MKNAGYTVLAVNPKFSTVDGDPCYPDLTSLSQRPDAIDLIVSPAVGELIIREAALSGLSGSGFSREPGAMILPS